MKSGRKQWKEESVAKELVYLLTTPSLVTATGSFSWGETRVCCLCFHGVLWLGVLSSRSFGCLRKRAGRRVLISPSSTP